MNKHTPKTGYQIVESYNAQPFGIIEGFKTLAELIEEELEARDAERDELKEAKRELLEALKSALRYIEVSTAYRGAMTAEKVEEAIKAEHFPAEIEIGANSCNTLARFNFVSTRAAIAKHSKGE